MPPPASRETLRFREFELDLGACELRRNGRTVRLERQPMDLLILLVERRRQLVARSEIVDRLWGKDVFVDVETGVHTAIRKVRQALRDSADAPAYVETVAGRGYRFIADVEVVAPAGSMPTDAEVVTSSLLAAVSPEPGTPRAPASLVRSGRRTRFTVGLLVAGLLAAAVFWAGARVARTDASAVTLAVLPFENLGGDPGLDYVADGLAEDTIGSLGQIDPERLRTIARTTTLGYKGTTKSVATIGRELGVDYLVESSVRAEGARLRITSRLIRVGDQVQVWSESYTREPASLLGLQQELSAAIAEQIRLRLSPERLDTLTRRQTRNAEAYDLYLRGRNFENQRTPATTRQAVEYYARATALDPEYALAWSGLAMAEAASQFNGDAPPRQVWPRAREAAVRAVRANPGLAEAQFVRAYVDWSLEWDWPAAEAGMRRAIAINPRFARAHLALGHLLSQTGRQREALLSVQRARELDPLNAMTHALSSQVAYQARENQAALEHAQQAITLDPEFWIGHIMLTQALEGLGQRDEALAATTKAGRFSEQNSKSLSLRGYVLAKAGQAGGARDILRTLESVAHTKYVPPYAMALVHAGLGDPDAVFASLDRAYEARDVHLIFLTADPKWDPFRADPRFDALLARCDFMRTSKRPPGT